LDRIKGAVMVGDDQTITGYKRTGATVDSADAIDKALCGGIEDLLGRQFDATLL